MADEQPSTEDSAQEDAKESLARALAFVRGYKYTNLANSTLDAAVEERIREIRGGEGDPGLLGSLDAFVRSVESAVEVLKSGE